MANGQLTNDPTPSTRPNIFSVSVFQNYSIFSSPPFGNIQQRATYTGTPHDTPYLFTGFFGNESDTNGLIHMRARYYSPVLRRFLNSDPARDGTNWYAYADGNPLGFVDPSGLGAKSAWNAVQTSLSFLGMLPAIGAVFDVVNAGISVGRGNYMDAGFNFASALPGIGNFAMGAKYAGAAAAGVASGYGAYKAYSAASHSAASFVPAANSGSKPFAMGLTDQGLDAFAQARGATTWKQLPDPDQWRAGVLNKLADPKTQVHFNLDGVDVWNGVSRSASGRGGPTDWELLTIRQNPQYWESLQFWKGGEKVTNPFE